MLTTLTRGLAILGKTIFFYTLGVFWIGLIAYIVAIPIALVERALGRKEPRLALTALHRYIGITSFFYRHATEVSIDSTAIAPEGSAVVVCNHHSYIDIFLLLHIFPRVQFSARRTLFMIPFLGWAMKILGHFSHDAARPEEAMRQAAERTGRGRFVAIFPEGTRSRECTIGSFRSGAFRLAQQTTGRVQPVVVTGTHRVWSKGQFWIHDLGPVLMQVLPPEDVPEHLGRQELLALIEKIRLKMLRAHAELSSRLPG